MTTSKETDLARLAEIAAVTADLPALYDERRTIWRRRLEAGDSTQAELARVSKVGRADVKKGATFRAAQ